MKARSHAASSSTRRSTTSTSRPIRSVRGAAAWLDRVGLAALLPGPEQALPSLWEAVAGTLEVTWGLEKPGGGFAFTPEMDRCWAWKDELPAKRLGAVGKHFGRWAALVAPRLVPAVHALAADRREALTPFQREVAAAVESHGPSTGPELRGLLGVDKSAVDGAVVALQRALVLTNAQLVEQDQGWPAIAVDLVERLWATGPVADPGGTLARTVLAAAGELSAADLGGALGRRVKWSRETLDALVADGAATRRVERDVVLYASA